MRTVFLSALLTFASALTLLGDTIVLFDGFDFPSTPGSTSTDINLDAATRQSGTIPTAYTQLVTGTGSNDALLEDSTLFGSDVLLLRTIHGSTATQTAVRTDANFAPAFAGQKWSVTYVGRLDRGSSSITDAWLAFAVGDQADFTGPNSPTADLGFVVQGNASWFAFVDGPIPPNGSGSAGALRSPDLWSGVFNVTITIDETLAQPTALRSSSGRAPSTSAHGTLTSITPPPVLSNCGEQWRQSIRRRCADGCARECFGAHASERLGAAADHPRVARVAIALGGRSALAERLRDRCGAAHLSMEPQRRADPECYRSDLFENKRARLRCGHLFRGGHELRGHRLRERGGKRALSDTGANDVGTARAVEPAHGPGDF